MRQAGEHAPILFGRRLRVPPLSISVGRRLSTTRWAVLCYRTCGHCAISILHVSLTQATRWSGAGPHGACGRCAWGVPWGCGWARHPAGPPLLRATAWRTRSRGSGLSLATRAAGAHDSPHFLSMCLAHPLPPCSTACWWRPPRSVCGHKDAVSIRRRPAPHTRRRGVPGHPPETTPSSVLASQGHAGHGACTYGSRVPTGDPGAYLRETPRVPTGDTRRVPTGDAPRTYGRRLSPEVIMLQRLMPLDCKEDCTTDTHTPCRV